MRTEKLRAHEIVGRFSMQEVYGSGPLFNPEHPRCIEAKQAVRLVRLASEVDRKHNELLSQLVLAQQDVKLASRRLHEIRQNYDWIVEHENMHHVVTGVDTYKNPPTLLRARELAVLNAHDKLWAAQRMLQLFDFTYGPTGGI